MKKISLIILFIFLVLSIVFGYLYFDNQRLLQIAKHKEETIALINNHYNDIVSTNKIANLYQKQDNSYVLYGSINKDVIIALKPLKIDENTQYFNLLDMDLYIKYEDVIKSDQTIIKNNRYLNYIVYNQNVKTKDITNFYDAKGLVYTINKSYDFPIIVKETDSYGVEFNNQLYYVLKDDVTSTYDNPNTTLKAKTSIRTLTYHAIYDEKTDTCTSSICLKTSEFEKQLKYISDNSYFALTLEELEMFIDKKIQIPLKSTVITIDDGFKMGDHVLDLLEKYKVMATLFVITGVYSPLSMFDSPYLNLESHTDSMHQVGQCAGYGLQGGGILCLPEATVLADLKTSQDKLGGSKYFAYPFFDFNDRAIALLKQSGFTMAFIGQWNTNGIATTNTNKFKVPRKTMFSDTSFTEFVSYLD